LEDFFKQQNTDSEKMNMDQILIPIFTIRAFIMEEASKMQQH